MSKTFTLFFLILFHLITYSQNKNNIDSLLKLVSQSKNDSVKAGLYIEISEQYWSANPDKCKEYANAALNISKNINSHYLLSGAYRNLGSASYFIGKNTKALYYDSLSFNEAILSGSELKIAKSCTNLGRDLTSFSKFDSANKVFDLGIKMAMKINDSKQLSALYLNKGNNFFYNSKIDSCEKYFQYGLKESLIINDTSRIVQFYNNIAAVKLQNGISDSVVINYLMNAILINEKRRDYLNLGDCYATLALAYNIRKNNEKTVYYLKKGIEALTIAKNETKTVTLIVSLADKFREMNLKDSAAFYADIAIERGERNLFKRGLATAYSIKGIVLSDNLKYEPARLYLQKAFLEFSENKDGEGILLSGNYLANVLSKQGKYKEAVSIATTVFNLADSTKNYPTIKNSSIILSEIFHKQGNDTKAYEYLNFYMAASDTIEKAQSASLLEDMVAKYESSKKELLIEKQKDSLARQKKERIYLIGGIVLLLCLLSAIAYLFFKTRKQKFAITSERNAVRNLTGILKHETARQFSSLNTSISKILRTENPQHQVAKAIVEVKTYQMLYDKLFLSSGFATISLKSAFEKLFHYNCGEYDVKNTPRFEVTGEGDLIFSKTDFLFHYINELIANSLLHAFKDISDPKISINISYLKPVCEIIYSDNGCGIPPEKQQIIPGKGLYLINAYAKQNMNGILETDFTRGSKFKLIFNPNNGKH